MSLSLAQAGEKAKEVPHIYLHIVVVLPVEHCCQREGLYGPDHLANSEFQQSLRRNPTSDRQMH